MNMPTVDLSRTTPDTVCILTRPSFVWRDVRRSEVEQARRNTRIGVDPTAPFYGWDVDESDCNALESKMNEKRDHVRNLAAMHQVRSATNQQIGGRSVMPSRKNYFVYDAAIIDRSMDHGCGREDINTGEWTACAECIEIDRHLSEPTHVCQENDGWPCSAVAKARNQQVSGGAS